MWQPIATAPKNPDIRLLGAVRGAALPVLICYDSHLDRWRSLYWRPTTVPWEPDYWMPIEPIPQE